MLTRFKTAGVAMAGLALAAATLAAPSGAAETAAKGGPQGNTVIGIANFGPHPALDQSVSGFKEEMRKHGYVEGRNTTYVYSDANFTPAMIPQILGQIEAKRPAVILTVTTPVSQAALSSITDKSLPMVFCLISDPVAAGLVPNWRQGSARFVGSASAMDYDAVLSFAKRMFPGARRFGVLYSPGEANDVVAIKAIEAASARQGLTLRSISVDASMDVPQRTQMLSDVDFVYAIGSNLVQSSMPAVASVTDRYKIPILSAETELIKKSGVVAVAYSASYAAQGAQAAQLAAKILDGKRPSELAPVKPGPEDYTTLISRKKLTQLGRPIPASMESCNCFVD
ncbi:ABC-type transporter [Cupriavidus necator]|uniref:ABC-type transporter n=2 Tax=Cupriavidus necator (strain ATCC 17699 / DSM 428 / KCTC 22496 / NCIMB 10442 / H16 / Stanier 337) TaxID=381666 RepID=Q0JYE9_CUPNH|nr:ABC transporter substrate-binding protein [Cupriavidus necator]WKA43923.1 ABC transporter substrate-binding protein [Cupriavidus necator]CAJ97225.1 ABC-type transporter [Cupriavidus necator H16]